jgi:ubiquinone/menaquinone biosynthesis C-methylase UbiE
MHIDPSKWDALDRAWTAQLEKAPHHPDAWRIEQMLATAPVQRILLHMLAIQPGWSVLDAGAGFGLLAMELAGQCALNVVGMDIDTGLLDTGRQVAARLDADQWFDHGAALQFVEGDLYDLSSEQARYDFIISRFVYQHLTDPELATDQLVGALKPGGHLCVIDVDDQLGITYPEPSDALERLQHAYAAVQEHRGGDRHVGRKLSTYLDGAGLDVSLTVVLPQAMHVPASVSDPGLAFTLSRLAQTREEIIQDGAMSPQEFDECMEIASAEQVTSRFTLAAQLVVIGTKPG